MALWVLACSAALLSAGCGRSGFTSAEKERIGKSGDGIMRLWLVSDPGDSLLLRRQASDVTRRMALSKSFATLKERLLATVNDPENTGVGIAAPQVGISCRLVAVQRFDKPGEPFEFYINPVITEFSPDKCTGREGCLSIPGKSGAVERSAAIEISYLDESFNPVSERIEGFTAIIFQHETDHLDGILYTDRASDITEE